MPNEELVKRLRAKLSDEAHIKTFDAALLALAGDNQQRVQHFAVTLRELFGHVLTSQAPNNQVETCVWYKKEPDARGPTRRQRALFLSRGGLSDSFIRDTLKLDPDEFHQDIKKSFDELSKNTHARPGTLPTEPDAIEEFADRAISSFVEVFDTVDDVRREIEGCLEPSLQDEAASVFIQETIDNLDIISSRYATEGVLFDETSVLEIGSGIHSLPDSWQC